MCARSLEVQAERRVAERRLTADVGASVRAMTPDQLAAVLAVIPARHRVFFRLLAATGLRISEAIALQWRHLYLDGSGPHVKVRRGVVRGTLGPPKSRYSRREIPLDEELVQALRELKRETEWPGDEDLVFPASNGAYLHVGNLRRRVLKPAREQVDLGWVGFHTFRHTCASLLFASGRNAVQVQRWLGHHSAAFTLGRYVHLLDGDLGEALSLPEQSALRQSQRESVRTGVDDATLRMCANGQSTTQEVRHGAA